MSEPLWALAVWEVVSAWPGQCETATLVKAALPKAALCVVACLCAGAIGTPRGQEDVLTPCFLWLVAARGLARGITCKSPVQGQRLPAWALEPEPLLEMRSLQGVKSQMKLLATLRYYY